MNKITEIPCFQLDQYFQSAVCEFATAVKEELAKQQIYVALRLQVQTDKSVYPFHFEDDKGQKSETFFLHYLATANIYSLYGIQNTMDGDAWQRFSDVVRVVKFWMTRGV